MPLISPHLRPVDPRTLRNVLGAFPTGVAIVTAIGSNGDPIGLTCNSLGSVSLTPPLISWCLRTASKSLSEFQSAPSFAVHILGEDQHQLANRFASGQVVNKFEGVDWRGGLLGVPLLPDCVATLECRSHAAHEAGDHWLFLGEVCHVDQERSEGSLVFYRGVYMQLARSMRQLVAEGKVDPNCLTEARRLLCSTLLQHACERATTEDLERIAMRIAEIDAFTGQESIQQRAAASIGFFNEIAQASHNDVLIVVSDTLADLVRQVMRADANLMPQPHLTPIRHRILDSLLQRDKNQALHWGNHYFDAFRQPGVVL